MKIYELTKPELDELINLCNFSPEELSYFTQRAKHYTNIQIGINCYWSESKVSTIARAVRKKIRKIREDF